MVHQIQHQLHSLEENDDSSSEREMHGDNPQSRQEENMKG